jgi:hypothetical protein
MTTTLEEANESLRHAVRTRLDATPADDPKMAGYKAVTEPLPEVEEAEEMQLDARLRRIKEEHIAQRLAGDGLTQTEVHPTSQAYFDLLDTLRQLHISKSAGYGCPDGTDPLLNIRRGAEFVCIPAWQGAMVRLSDKVTRLSVFNKTGNLPHESVEDTLLDLASYSLLALLLYREERDDRAPL